MLIDNVMSQVAQKCINIVKHGVTLKFVSGCDACVIPQTWNCIYFCYKLIFIFNVFYMVNKKYIL